MQFVEEFYLFCTLSKFSIAEKKNIKISKEIKIVLCVFQK